MNCAGSKDTPATPSSSSNRLTAQALGLAVTLVTAMQVIRMRLIQAACLPLYRLLNQVPDEQPLKRAALW
ncbi:AbrB family transcriptional regulator [Pseudomonas sp. S35]|uniref:AbrB family transcriptional regulator n=1 Tax=Pseudomonas sp. S35 TaxID=1573719 RepID=UPI001EEAA883|nr:AbrB family transcriptional regulator [Pseudomonas sp. S35]